MRGDVSEGEFLGTERELVKHFQVSRPSLREALKRLEGEGLVTVVLGVRGGVVAHRPDERTARRSVAAVLSARGIELSDLLEAHAQFSSVVVGQLAAMRKRERLVTKLRSLIPADVSNLAAHEYYAASDAFQRFLIDQAPNRTLGVMTATLHQIVVQSSVPRRIQAIFESEADRGRDAQAHHHVTDLLEAGAESEAQSSWRDVLSARFPAESGPITFRCF